MEKIEHAPTDDHGIKEGYGRGDEGHKGAHPCKFLACGSHYRPDHPFSAVDPDRLLTDNHRNTPEKKEYAPYQDERPGALVASNLRHYSRKSPDISRSYGYSKRT